MLTAPVKDNRTYNAVGDSAANVVGLFASEEMPSRRARGEESDGEEDAGEEDHPDANAQHHRLDQRQTGRVEEEEGEVEKKEEDEINKSTSLRT